MNVYGSRKIVEIFPSLENSCWPVQPRKVKLSRGGAEGNQAFVKDMETEENYVQPRMKFLESEFRSDVGCLRGYYLLKKMSDDDWYDEWELKEALQPCGLMTKIPTLGHKDHWGFLFQVSENILRLETAIQWAIRGGMAFKTLAACCEIFQQNQPSDFLGTAVQCALELLVWVSKLEHNANPP